MEMGNESWSFLAALLYLSAFFFSLKATVEVSPARSLLPVLSLLQ